MKPLAQIFLACFLLAVVAPTVLFIGDVLQLDPADAAGGLRPAPRLDGPARGADAAESALAMPEAQRRAVAGPDATAGGGADLAVDWTPAPVREMTVRRARGEEVILEQTRGRAQRLAGQVGLDAEGAQVLTGILVGQRARFEGLNGRVSALPREARRDAMRAGFREITAWHTGQLEEHFGAETARRILRPGNVAVADGSTQRQVR